MIFSASVAPESIRLQFSPDFHSRFSTPFRQFIISRSLVFLLFAQLRRNFCWSSTYADLQESLFQRSWEVCFIISRSQKPLFEFRNQLENAFELLPKCSVFHFACAWLKSKHVKFRTKWKPAQPAFQYLAEDLGRYVLSQGLDLKTIETLCKHGAFALEVSRRHKVGSKPAIQM